ncbi:MAG: SRPBCC domain-containing protein [Patescibacteria group bacterium]|jgi:uncharacterized protein YndB with AHSA1/START domain
MTQENFSIAHTRVIGATRKRVWQAFTDPEHISEWWGPNGFTTETETMDVRPGGAWRSVMRGPDGETYPNHFTYKEVVEPERLVYAHGDFQVGETWYKGFTSEVMFEEEGRKTKVTLRAVFASEEELEKQKMLGADEGGAQTLARLDSYLSK